MRFLKRNHLASTCALFIAAGIASCATEEELETSVGAQTASAAGVVPSGMPPRLAVGLFEDTGSTWMKSSGVKWDVRYRYFTKGWVNNWGWSAYDGSWGLAYMRECDAQGFLPAIQYYQMNGEAGGSESAFLSKAQNAATMRSYFGDFKLLMQRAKDFGKPVVVLLEADGFAFLQRQANDNVSTYAAVAASGVSELAGLPNTVAGWGLAFLQLRKSVGASNVVLGVHVSAWASGKDLLHYSVTDALGPEVNKVYSFLSTLGLAPNVTGATYDVLVGDPLDRDAGFYELTQGQNKWWDTSDSAPINSKSFNRFAEWLRLWNVASGKRWVLWQIPLGNSNHRNVSNDGTSRAGYKDNRPEYWFGSGAAAHRQKFVDVGVISLLFGAGAGGQSSYTNDTYTDGQLFMKSRAGAFLNAGGLPLGGGAPGGTAGDAGPGGTDATAPTPPPIAPSGDTALYNFESSTQGWTSGGAPISGVAVSTAVAYQGVKSLGVSFAARGVSVQQVFVASPPIGAGRTVTLRLFVPSGHQLDWVQPYVQQGAAGGWKWTGNWQPISNLKAGAWTTLTVQVPTNAVSLYQLGVQYSSKASWTGTTYVDAITW